jgi:CrcB protein
MRQRVVGAVAAGGFAGALARHAVGATLSTTFPWGTLAANVAGAFLLGVIVYGAVERSRLSVVARRFAATGFLSSFTTYSAFVGETLALGRPLAAVYVVATYALGLVAVLLGRGVVRWRS